MNSGILFSVVFSPDSKKVFTGGMNGTAHIWDAASGAELKKIEVRSAWLSLVTFSLDGTKVVTGSIEGIAVIWDSESGEELKKLEGHTSPVISAAFSSDGKRVVTGSGNQNTKTVRIVNGAVEEEKEEVKGDGDVSARIWDAETGKELKTLYGHTGEVESVAFSPDGKRVVTGSRDKTARIWDWERVQPPKRPAIMDF
jgi:WD40 repeat protein